MEKIKFVRDPLMYFVRAGGPGGGVLCGVSSLLSNKVYITITRASLLEHDTPY